MCASFVEKRREIFILVVAALSDALREEIQRLKVVTTISNTSNGDSMHAGPSHSHNQQFNLQQHYGFATQAQPQPHRSHPLSTPSDIMTE